MGFPGRPLGDGLLVRHGYATENTWYNPAGSHGRGLVPARGETGGMGVYAAAAGEVVFAGRSTPVWSSLWSTRMASTRCTGILDYALAVEAGQSVERGRCWDRSSPAATVWPRVTPLRVRTFFTTPEVNGNAPLRRRLRLRLPARSRLLANGRAGASLRNGLAQPDPRHQPPAGRCGGAEGTEVVVSVTAPETTPLWSAPRMGRRRTGG